MIDGPVKADDLKGFWENRATYIDKTFGNDEDYYEKVVSEFDKLKNIPVNTKINLWFEYDLFCQANRWFTLWLLNQLNQNQIYQVAPIITQNNSVWNGFGHLTNEDLKKCFLGRRRFSPDEIQFGINLWEAFRNEDFDELSCLSITKTACFPYLYEVCQAEIERKTQQQPEKTVQKILADGITNFNEVYRQFFTKEGIYGFGDWQVKHIYEKLLSTQ